MKTTFKQHRNPNRSGERSWSEFPLGLKRLAALLSHLQNFGPEREHEVSVVLRRYGGSLNLAIRHEGEDKAVSRFKEIYLVARAIALGKPFNPIPGLSSDKNGVPRLIKPLVPLLTGTDVEKRVALTITRVYLAIYSNGDPDLTPITTPYTGGEFPYERGVKFISEFGPRPFAQADWEPSGLHSTSKAGPNGPALETADIDAYILTTQRPDLIEDMKVMSGDDIANYIYDVANNVEESRIANRRLRLSKLSVVREGGCKNRVIAIGDYWTQESLKTLHVECFKGLRKQHEDGTFNQDTPVRLVRRALAEEFPVFCFDLSNATDRLPIGLQIPVVAAMTGSIEKAEAGGRLLTNRTFQYGTEEVSYSVGQPMGFYSSGSVFTVTHHLLIRFCGSLSGAKTRKRYTLIGDDVSLFNERLAECYRDIMTTLGVPISQAKSSISRPSDPGIRYGEIAKRLITLDSEITPIPILLVKSGASAPAREALTLRIGLENIGLGLSTPLGEALSRRFSQSRLFLAVVTAPSYLIGTNLANVPSELQEVFVGPGAHKDFKHLGVVLRGLVMNKLLDLRGRFLEKWYGKEGLDIPDFITYDPETGETSSPSLGQPIHTTGGMHPYMWVISRLLRDKSKTLFGSLHYQKTNWGGVYDPTHLMKEKPSEIREHIQQLVLWTNELTQTYLPQRNPRKVSLVARAGLIGGLGSALPNKPAPGEENRTGDVSRPLLKTRGSPPDV